MLHRRPKFAARVASAIRRVHVAKHNGRKHVPENDMSNTVARKLGETL